MAGDGKNDVHIPAVFLYRENGEKLKYHFFENPDLVIRLAQNSLNPGFFIN